MKFYIDRETREAVWGWLAPDNPTSIPKFRIELNSEEVLVFDANEWRTDIVDARMHETGLVGFFVDDRLISGFSRAREVTISESKTNKIIYRRVDDASFVPRRLFIFNNLPVFSRHMRTVLSNRFLLAYPMIENSGLETALSLMGNNLISSIAAEGRFAVGTHMGFFRHFDFHLSALLVDPFIELANRLLFVRAVENAPSAPPLSILPPHFSDLRGLALRCGGFGRGEIALAFSDLSESEQLVVRDPVTRLLACAPGEHAEPRHVAVALTLLSEFHSVGVAHAGELYREAVSAQIPELDMGDFKFLELPGGQELAEVLRDDSTVRKLLRNDIRTFHYVQESVAQAANVEDESASPESIIQAMRRG